MKINQTSKLIFFILAVICSNSIFAQSDFLPQQKKYARVRTAIKEKEQILTENLRKNGLAMDNVHILIAAYKAEEKLEIYAKKKSETVYKLIALYDVCESSGVLGPKRRQGDRQVPEGFYKIDRFNPSSNFYLSLGINYPNQSDRKKSNFSNLGGDIFIHGDCVTIGCLPMTNDKIKEIYLYTVFARDNGQTDIPVYIFPFRMTDSNFQTYKKKYSQNQSLIDFWGNLKIGYEKFVSDKKALKITVNPSGDYQF